MTEIDKHYGSPRSSGRGRAGRPGSSEGAALDRVGEAYEQASDWARERYEDVSRNAVYARRRSAAELNRGRRTVEDFIQENPIMVGVAGLAAGLLVGALLPGTRRENEVLGRYADEVRDQGMRYAQGLAEQGRHIVEENLSRVVAARTDRDSGDETGVER